MNLEQVRKFSPQIRTIASKHGITAVFVFGSVARNENTPLSDVDFLVDMQPGASLFGVAGFSYEVEQLLGLPIDVVPSSVLPKVTDKDFVSKIQKEAVPL